VSTTLQKLGIHKLSIAERVSLAQEILDTVIAEQPRPKLSKAKKDELERRLADHFANPDDVVSWEEVKMSARKRHGR
jgi:putative addiction module component (TIGR02574 family)